MTERDRPGDLNGVPLRDAADQLNMSVEAVRMRIRRKSLTAYKSDGRWYVVLPERDQDATDQTTSGQETKQTTTRDPGHVHGRDQDTYVQHLEEEIEYLRRENERLAVAVVEQSRRLPTLRAIEAPQTSQTAGHDSHVDKGTNEPRTGRFWQSWRLFRKGG